MTDKIIVFTTCDTAKQAAKLARHLVEQRVAACVNILPKGRSIYRWNGKLEEAAEQLLMIKTRRDLFSSLRAEIGKAHTYEVPEIIAIPVVEGSDAYLGWIDQEVTAPGSE
jgi:periplasmic divalent cation tolerance protein